MNTATDTATKVQAKLAKLSTEDLIRSFEGTDAEMDKAAERQDGERYSHVVRVRGWLMDALEARDGEAFDRYLESDATNADLRQEFLPVVTAKLVAGVGFVMVGA